MIIFLLENVYFVEEKLHNSQKIAVKNVNFSAVTYVTQSSDHFKYEDMYQSLKSKVFYTDGVLNFAVRHIFCLESDYCRHSIISKLKNLV